MIQHPGSIISSSLSLKVGRPSVRNIANGTAAAWYPEEVEALPERKKVEFGQPVQDLATESLLQYKKNQKRKIEALELKHKQDIAALSKQARQHSKHLESQLAEAQTRIETAENSVLDLQRTVAQQEIIIGTATERVEHERCLSLIHEANLFITVIERCVSQATLEDAKRISDEMRLSMEMEQKKSDPDS